MSQHADDMGGDARTRSRVNTVLAGCHVLHDEHSCTDYDNGECAADTFDTFAQSQVTGVAVD